MCACACAQAYDGASAGLSLHDVVEVVGVLSHMPELAQMQFQSEAGMTDADMAEQALAAAHPPTSQVIRLHAVTLRRAPDLLPGPAPSAAAAQPATIDAAAVPALRQRAVSVLAACLGGDSLAAEYLLMQLVARVTARYGETRHGANATMLVEG